MPDIVPKGLDKGDLVDVLYGLLVSIQGLCAKLDADGGVTAETFLANCYTNIFTVSVEDQKGNVLYPGGDYHLSPVGMSDPGLLTLLYQLYDSIETLTEQLDSDGLTDDTYEALGYEALVTTSMITNLVGDTLGNGNNHWLKPGGVMPQDKLVDVLYDLVNSWETICEQLDGDATVSDTNYEALWFTATILNTIENSGGNTVGN